MGQKAWGWTAPALAGSRRAKQGVGPDLFSFESLVFST